MSNEKKKLDARSRILRALGSGDSEVGFNRLREYTCVSTRTLNKNLKAFLESRDVEKVDGKYRLTEAGKLRREHVKLELEILKQPAPPLPPETIEVYSIGPDYCCNGTMTVFSKRKLPYKERIGLDEVLTQTIHTVKSSIPAGSMNAKVSIVWRRKP